MIDEPVHDAPEPIATLNTTPLVDVMLVLLIIFLITVPVVATQAPVRLPHATASPVEEARDSVSVVVHRDGRVSVAGAEVAGPALSAALQEVAGRQPVPPVHVRADAEVPYAAVGRVLAACRRAGLSRIGFITQPAEPGA
ncbi:ExbD/TolR family protein [Pararhodospirillum photometricum]|nr:biopolymer transporter ExbD [Pararhodospirillum photometricum]